MAPNPSIIFVKLRRCWRYRGHITRFLHYLMLSFLRVRGSTSKLFRCCPLELSLVGCPRKVYVYSCISTNAGTFGCIKNKLDKPSNGTHTRCWSQPTSAKHVSPTPRI